MNKKLLKICPACKSSQNGCYSHTLIWKGKEVRATHCNMINKMANKLI